MLTKSLCATVFRDYYWLKVELQSFCREQGLSTVGTKTELAQRIETYLRTGRSVAVTHRRRKTGQMPEHFSLNSVIGDGWRCTKELRTFFVERIGPGFRFNAVMRRFIHEQPGRTLAEAINAYHKGHSGAQNADIGAQFEYNRFTRDYWLKHPDSTRDDVIAAWYEFRNTAKSKR